MENIQGNWTLLPKQEEFIRSKAGKLAYVGGFGSGKTVAGAIRTYLLCNHIPGNRIIVLRRTYRELQDSTRRTFMEWLPKELFLGERKKDDIVYIKSRGSAPSEVWFRSLNNPAKFKSVDAGGFWIDEATEAVRDEFNMLWGRRNRLPHVHYPSAYLTTNPCPKSHWLYDMFVGEKEDGDGTQLIQASTYENRKHLPRGYIEELEQTYPPDWIEMYLKGQFGITLEGVPVTPGFKPVIEVNKVRVPWHVAPYSIPWLKDVPLRRGWDPGRVRPAAVVWQRAPNQQWRKLWEMLGNNSPGNVFIPMVKNILAEKFPGAYWLDYMDPAGFQQSQVDDRSYFDELSAHGIKVIRIRKTSPSSRADLINRLLAQTTTDGQPMITYDPSCEITIEAMRGGWHRKKPELGKAIDDDPVKDGYYEHLMDGDGYTLVGGIEANAPATSTTRGRIRSAHRKRARSYR